MSNNGFNPIRWNCLDRGCFNFHKRPKIEEFAECLPGKIAFTDIDAIVEVGGHFLLMEWKEAKGAIQRGQDLMFQRMAETGVFTCVVVVGDEKTMEVSEIKTYNVDGVSDWRVCDFSQLKEAIQSWANRHQGKRFKPVM